MFATLKCVIVSLMAHSVIYNKEVDMSLAKRVIGQAIKKIEKKKLLLIISLILCANSSILNLN